MLNSADGYVTATVAARHLRVSPSTIQRLCNRGLLDHSATSGGHRRIAVSSLRRLATQFHGEPIAEPDREPSIPLAVPSDRLLECVLNGEVRTLLASLTQSHNGPASRAAKLDETVCSLLGELDAAFTCGTLPGHQIWLAVQTIRQALEVYSAKIVLPGRAPLAVGGTILGNRDQLATRCVEIGLRLCAINANNLGGDLPAKMLADLAAARRARLVWVCHSHVADVQACTRWHHELAEQLPSNIRVLIGGGALSPSLRQELPTHTYYESIAALVEQEVRASHSDLM